MTLSKFKYIKYFKIAWRDFLRSQYKETANTTGEGHANYCHSIDTQCMHMLNYSLQAGEWLRY